MNDQVFTSRLGPRRWRGRGAERSVDVQRETFEVTCVRGNQDQQDGVYLYPFPLPRDQPQSNLKVLDM